MPFGKKKSEKEKKPSGPSYPTQGAAGGYPTQPPPAPAPQQMYAAPPPYGQGPPPPYSATAAGQQAPPPQGYYPPPQGYGAPPPQGYAAPPPQQYAQPPPRPAGNTTVVLQGGFDAGARFDGISQPNVPPPPPGYAPNAAQRAMVRGQNVVVTQRAGNFWEGGSDGGYVLF